MNFFLVICNNQNNIRKTILKLKIIFIAIIEKKNLSK